MKSEDEIHVEIQEVLSHLEAVSYVAHRDVSRVLPVVEPLGAQAMLAWIEAAREVFFHDRDAGKAFINNTPAAVEYIGALEPWMHQARELARVAGAHRAVEGFMAQVGRVYTTSGSEGESGWYGHGRAWLQRHVESADAYFMTSYERLVGDGDGDALDELMQPALALFDERRLPLAQYLEGALQVRELVGIDGVTDWARRGADIMASGRQRGEAYFRLETEESIALLMEAIPGFRTKGHGRLLQLLGVVWFDETVPLADSEWRPHHGRPMIETDGRTIYVPAVLADREEAILGVIHVMGHLHFDTYRRDHIEQLFEAAGQQHPPLDADQRITWRPLFAGYGDDMFRFQLLLDLCEDLRVDARIGARVPNYLQRLLGRAERGPVPSEPARTYYLAAKASIEGALGDSELDQRLAPLLHAEARLTDAFRVARTLYDSGEFPPIGVEQRREAYLPGRGHNAARPVYPRRAPGEEGETEQAESNAAGRREESRESKPAKAPREGQGDPDMDIAPENTAGSGGRIGVGIPEPAQVIAQGVVRRPNQEGVPYPEWDYRAQQYLSDWARVIERRPDERDAARAEALLAEHGNVLKRLRRALQMQRPNRPAPLRRQLDGDDLDLDAAVAYVSERRAGRSPKPLVYQRRAISRRETGVLVLADMSTSIMQHAKRGRGQVVDRLRAGLLLFSEALEAVGDPYAICGFASKYHDNVYYYSVKDFDEPMTPDVRASLGGITGRLASRMGAAIRHAIARFHSVGVQQRLLLILSDGRPADYDDGGDVRYLHEDTRRAMKEAVDAGIHPFCVTLDPAGSEYLPAIFGPGHYMVIDNVDDLPARLPEIYLRLRR